MAETLRVLILEDTEKDALLMVRALEAYGYDVTWQRVELRDAYRAALEKPWDLLLADYDLPQFTAQEALALYQQMDAEYPFVMISGVVGEEIAVEMVKRGAHDYVMKDRLGRLGPAVERERQRLAERRQLQATAEQLKAEHGYRETLEQFRRLLETLPTAAYTCDPAGQITWFNSQAEALWGQSPPLNSSEVRYCGAFRLRTPEGTPWDPEDSWMARAIRDNRTYRGREQVIERPDESRCTVLCYAHPFPGADGNPLGAVNVLVDVTDRSLFQQSLRRLNDDLEQRVLERTAELVAANERLRSIFENSNDAILVIDPHQNEIVEANPKACDLLGYSHRELLELPLSVLYPDEAAALSHFLSAVAQRGSGQTDELSCRNRTGQRVPVEISAGVIPFNGRDCLHAVVRDITARKIAEDDLRRTQMRLNEAQRIGGIGSWEWDFATGNTWWSAELYRILEVDPATFTPSFESLVERVHPQDRASLQTRIRLLLDQDEPFEVEYRVPTSSGGTERSHVCTAEVTRDSAGKPLRVLATVQDVTQQRETQARLNRAERLAALGTLSAGIAHEINNPMSAAWTAAETARLVKHQPDSDDILDESLDTIANAVQRCQVIINNVLRLARQESSPKEPGNLNEAVRLAVETTQHFVRYQNATLLLDLAEPLPEARMNVAEIEQVIVNLIRNAVQAGQQTIVNVSTGQALGQVFVKIQDNGRGIPPEQLDRIFDPFFTHQKTANGTGLGLAISHGIVEDHGGSIEVTSQVDSGTTLVVLLPTVSPAPP